MPWATLELDPSLATERDIKRAYAKRLKTCRPDQDPEGFRKLHDAYTAALHELQWREMPARVPVSIGDFEVAPSSDEETASTSAPMAEATLTAPEAADLSPGLQAIADAFDRIEAAIKNGQQGVGGLMREAETALYNHPSEVLRWGELMHDLIVKHSDHPEIRLKPDAMLFELEHGGAAATVAIIERLDRQGSPQGISNLANLLLQNKQRIANPGAGLAAARLACAAAFWVKRHSAPLADLAYQHLARGERDFHMELIDRHGSMAKLLYVVPERLKSYWRQRLMNTPGSDAWADDESLEALQWLRTGVTRGSQTFQVLLSLLPEQLAADFSSRVKPSSMPKVEPGTLSSGAGETIERQHRSSERRTATASVPEPRRRPVETPEWDRDDRPARQRAQHREPRYEPAARSGVRWPFYLLIVFVVKLVLAAVTCSDRSSRYGQTLPDKARVLDKEEILKILGEHETRGKTAATQP